MHQIKNTQHDLCSSNLGSDLAHVHDPINLLNYLEVIAKRWSMISKVTTFAFVLSIIIALMLPKYYTSTARILPPQQDQGVAGIMMQMVGVGAASMASDLLEKGSTADMYVGILKSEAISDPIIDRFNLIAVYKQNNRIDTYKILNKNVDITAGKKDGIISIIVEDKDPKRAADMANAFVNELGKLTVKLNIAGAAKNKTFLDERLVIAKINLANAEEELKSFQSKNKALDIPEQVKGTIKGVADLEAQLAVEEVKLASLKRVYTDSSQDVKNQQAVVINLQRQISKFEGMHPSSSILGLSSVPEKGQQYIRLMREFKIKETLVELLTKQNEIAKLSEANEIYGVKEIQIARESDKKSKPKRAVLVLMATCATFFLAVFLAFVQDYASKMPDNEKDRWRKLGATSVLWQKSNNRNPATDEI